MAGSHPNRVHGLAPAVRCHSGRGWHGPTLFPAQPKTLPAGTHILVSGPFDNSPQNLANPDPTATVTWGDQTSSEMFVGFIDYVN